MSRYAQLSKLEADYAAGCVSDEVATKRAAQLIGAFKKDRPTWARCVLLWNRARNQVSSKARKRK